MGIDDLGGTDAVTIALALLSLGYTVWVDRFKYQGRPGVYVEYTSEGAEMTIVNRNEYPIQIVSVTRRVGGFGLLKHAEETLQTFGRRPPFVLNPGDKAVTGVPYPAGSRRAATIRVHVRSGAISVFGRPKSATVELRLDGKIPEELRRGDDQPAISPVARRSSIGGQTASLFTPPRGLNGDRPSLPGPTSAAATGKSSLPAPAAKEQDPED